MTDDRCYQQLGAAFVRGRSLTDGDPVLTGELLQTPLERLDESQLAILFQAGGAGGLRMHKFNKTIALPRVQRVFGILRNVWPSELLDLGSGHVAFLWPFLDTFPHARPPPSIRLLSGQQISGQFSSGE